MRIMQMSCIEFDNFLNKNTETIPDSSFLFFALVK